MGEVLVGLFLAPFLFWIYDWALAHAALIRWPQGSWVTWPLAFLLGDFCYYLNHRAGHRVGFLWAVHGVHHQSDEFHLAVALRHPWFSDVCAWPFYAPLPLLGVPPEQFFIAISVISYYSLSIHSHTFAWSGLWAFVTPRTHQLHHTQNRRYLGKNLGAMFTLWDRALGTHVEPDPTDPPRFGTPRGYRTHNGVLAQWVFFRDMVKLCRQTPSWRERLRVFFGPPGYVPPGTKLEPEPPARDDRDVPLAVRVYVLANFTLASVFALWILWFRDRHSWALMGAATGCLLVTLGTLGALLDGSSSSRRWESVRIMVIVPLALFWSLRGFPGTR
jgi:sterol desaturase/sphingolipid hydroxylase (fatty acid hydroxylase superfamily)